MNDSITFPNSKFILLSAVQNKRKDSFYEGSCAVKHTEKGKFYGTYCFHEDLQSGFIQVLQDKIQGLFQDFSRTTKIFFKYLVITVTAKLVFISVLLYPIFIKNALSPRNLIDLQHSTHVQMFLFCMVTRDIDSQTCQTLVQG